jgi:hypothetical protein
MRLRHRAVGTIAVLLAHIVLSVNGVAAADDKVLLGGGAILADVNAKGSPGAGFSPIPA